MPRLVFLLLLLLNALALAWVSGQFGDTSRTGREPGRPAAQLAADRIRIAAPADDASLSATAQACRAIVLPFATAQQVATGWAAGMPDARIAVAPLVGAPVYDLVIPGLTSRAAAETKLGEVRKLGGEGDIQIVVNAESRYSLLLATFSDQKQAEAALKNVYARGVRSAALANRPARIEQAVIEVRGGADTMQKLPALIAAAGNAVAAECRVP